MEQWKDIPGYEGIYQVSDKGRIKSFDRYASIRDGGVRLVPGGIIKPMQCTNGYLEASLNKEGVRRVFLLHRLEATLFVPNPYEYPQVNHKDENLQNNVAENLEWCTAKYNANYGTRNERFAKKIMKSINQYDKSGTFLKRWDGAILVERELGILGEMVARCCLGKQKTAGGYRWEYASE